MKNSEHLDDVRGDIEEKIICSINNIRKIKRKAMKLKVLTIIFSFFITFLSSTNLTYIGLTEQMTNILIALCSALIPALIAYEGIIADSKLIKQQTITLHRLTELKHDINLWQMEEMDEDHLDLNKVNQIQKKFDDIIKRELL
ncbi:hypothetical protein [Neobacillus sp. OS1-33]|uniref:hypothetical protein n=1 Tax=Neobacillus sp. OS1-33 TaxID=3070683 RepID=UPI0027E07800|nr:hypothetical protein [Neobacillus sp. OS1-33]WML24720.1 hypothetical protein RCG22_17895 [Neobacillus sp. OS1-33]